MQPQFDGKALGARIMRRRQEMGLQQKEFANSINFSVSFYGHIERGTRIPSLPTLVMIANKLHIGLDALLRDSLVAPCLPRKVFTDRELGILCLDEETAYDALDSWLEPEEACT